MRFDFPLQIPGFFFNYTELGDLIEVGIRAFRHVGRWRNWFFRACFLRSDLRLRTAPDLTHKGASTSALQKAIGTRLGKAANDCKTTDLTFALEIQGDLGATGSPDANGQYAAIQRKACALRRRDRLFGRCWRPNHSVGRDRRPWHGIVRLFFLQCHWVKSLKRSRSDNLYDG
jgi:hypothetical protein